MCHPIEIDVLAVNCARWQALQSSESIERSTKEQMYVGYEWLKTRVIYARLMDT
jgi:hypothetical protein